MNQRNRTFRHVDPLLGEAVRAGTAWLDEHYPGWEQRIERPIRVASPHDCLLGQVVPRVVGEIDVGTGYAAAMIVHAGDMQFVGDLGFAPHLDSNMPGTAQFEMLDDLWTEVVTSRRAAAAL